MSTAGERLSVRRLNEAGMVSIMVTMVLMIIVSLISLGFAQIIRREQRQALDRQLASRAFYAAESGVNTAVDAIENKNYTRNKTSCLPDASGPLTSNAMRVDSTTDDPLITCLTIDQSPPTLEYGNIGTQSQIIPIKATTGTFNRIALSWESTAPAATSYPCTTATAGAAGRFPTASSWSCGAPVLRVDLVPVPGSLNRTVMLNGTFTAFLYPLRDGTGVSTFPFASATGPTNQGAIIGTNCKSSVVPPLNPRHCTLQITGVPVSSAPGDATDRYYARVTALYGPAALTVYALDALNNQVPLSGAQALIDSTAKSVDILRRIQVRRPIHASDPVANFALESAAGLCKQYTVIPPLGSLSIGGSGGCAIN